MITIDEAIAYEREVAEERRVQSIKFEAVDNINMCLECVEKHKQLADWLEELKRLRENSNGYSKEDIELNRKAMYNKAIDECLRIITFYKDEWDGMYSAIERIEQLKAGE